MKYGKSDRNMKQIKMCKAIIALVVALAFVLPGSAAFTTVEQTMNKNISSSEVDVISDVIPDDSIDLPLLTLDEAKSYVNSDNIEKILENSDVDWWPMFHHDLNNTGNSSSIAPDTNNVLWEYGTGGTVASSPAVVGGKVFVGSIDGNVYCLDALTGAWIWQYPTGKEVWSSPAVVDGKVFVGSGQIASGASNVYCLGASTGLKIWNYTASGGVDSSPAVADGKVFVGSHDGNLHCLNASTGAWIWKYPTGGGVYSSPAVADGKVYFGSKDCNLYCLNASTGAWIWNYPTPTAMVMSSPAVVGGKVFFGTMQPPFGYVYCLNALTGALIWQHATMGTMVQSSPAVADGKVFVGSYGGKLYCLDASDGHEIWNRPAGSGGVLSSPAVADGKVYFGSYDNNVYCLDESTGAIIWQHLTADDVASSPAVADGKIFIGSKDNFIYCFGPEPSNTIYVDDDAASSWYDATHVKTIQEGVNNATAGYTVYVYNGTYREHVTVDKQLDLVGESRENVVVNGSGTGTVVRIIVNDVNISAFTIKNGGEYGVYLDSSSNCTFTECRIIDNVGTYGFYGKYSDFTSIIGGEYSRNGFSGSEGTGYNIYIEGSDSVTIDNVIVDDPVQGEEDKRHDSAYGIKLFDSDNFIINNVSGSPTNLIENGEYGIYIHNSFDGTIANSNFTDGWNFGIYLYYSLRCNIMNCSV